MEPANGTMRANIFTLKHALPLGGMGLALKDPGAQTDTHGVIALSG